MYIYIDIYKYLLKKHSPIFKYNLQWPFTLANLKIRFEELFTKQNARQFPNLIFKCYELKQNTRQF